MFQFIKDNLLSPEALTYVQKRFEVELQRLQKEEAAAVAPSDEAKRLGAQIAKLRELGSAGVLSPAAAHAAIEVAGRQRDTAVGRKAAKRNSQLQRAHNAVAAIPELMDKYRKQVQQAMRMVADPQRVHAWLALIKW